MITIFSSIISRLTENYSNQLCAFVFGDQTDNDIVVGRLFIDKYGSLSVRNPDITIIEEADEVKSKALGTGTGDSYYPHNINQPILSYEHSVHCSIRGQRLDHHYFIKSKSKNFTNYLNTEPVINFER